VSGAGSLPAQATRVALVTLALIAATALLVAAAGAGDRARELIGLRFAGPSGRPADALQVATTNLRLAASALIAAWAVRGRPQLRRPLDVTLAIVGGLNAATMGVALGAYDDRLLGSIALHAPLELGALAVAGGAYLDGRDGMLPTGALAAAAAAAVGLIAVGAVLETYVQIGGDR
jgi:hypothetical protein